MNCRETQRLVGAWRDGELDKARGNEVSQHLGSCTECRAHEQVLEKASNVLQREFAVETPNDLADRAFRAAMTAEPAATSFLASIFPIAWPASLVGSMAAAALLFLSLTPALSSEPMDAHPIDLVFSNSSAQQVQEVFQGALGVDLEGSDSGGQR